MQITVACWLARLLRWGVLPEGYISPKAGRAVRDVLRKRSHLVRQQTACRAVAACGSGLLQSHPRLNQRSAYLLGSHYVYTDLFPLLNYSQILRYSWLHTLATYEWMGIWVGGVIGDIRRTVAFIQDVRSCAPKASIDSRAPFWNRRSL